MDILIEEMAGGVWVAALEKKILQGLEFDPPGEEVRWGSLYWAKVARIDKAQDAVYVNLDGDNIGILYNADVRVRDKAGAYKKGGDKDIGKYLQPGQMIAVQAKSGFLPEEDLPFSKAGSKAPRVSMDITLQGRYMVFSPMEHENRISQRIKDKKMREQMRKMLDSLTECHGCILRAAGANTQTDILVREAKILSLMWEQLQEFLEGDAPQLIMDGPDAISRTLSDHATRQIDRIEVTTIDHYQLAEEWCDIYAPDLMTKIQPVEVDGASQDFALFDHYDIIPQIEALFHPYAIMPNGSTIVIQETSAFTAVDVNSAADSRGNLAVNLDAAAEIARQIRVRNLGGAIIIDFLKMKSQKERDEVKTALEKYFNNDPCTVQIHGWTGLGMMEITRARRTPPLQARYESMIASSENGG